jgi:uncharacterized membrane-anchored protein YjiN (DUF445 family)
MHNRKKANLTLFIVFILFLISLILKHSFHGNFFADMLYYVSEAALIGGIADWFAVTALFTKPLGFSWHTALIPNNRKALTDTVANMVKNELLSADSISEKISGINSVELITAWGGKNDWNKSFGELAARYIHDRANLINKHTAAEDIETFVKSSTKNILLSEKIKTSLDKALEKDKSKEWVSWFAKKASDVIRSDAAWQKIYKSIRGLEKKETNSTADFNALLLKTFLAFSRKSEHNNTLVLATLLQNELVEMFEELKSPTHPLHNKINERFEHLVQTLKSNNDLSVAIESWKGGIIDRISLKDPLSKIIDSALKSETFKTVTTEWGAKQLDQYWEQLKQDPETRKWIDEILRSALIRIIKMEHYLVGEIARETLEAFTDNKLNKFIEDKVGNDLQWIRINGSLVGGAAGLLLFLFLRLLYDPYVLPLVHGWVIR